MDATNCVIISQVMSLLRLLTQNTALRVKSFAALIAIDGRAAWTCYVRKYATFSVAYFRRVFEQLKYQRQTSHLSSQLLTVLAG